MDVKEIVKVGGGIVVNVGTSMIASAAIESVAPVAGACLVAKGAVRVGKWVLSDMVAFKATEHFETMVDEAARRIEVVKDDIKRVRH